MSRWTDCKSQASQGRPRQIANENTCPSSSNRLRSQRLHAWESRCQSSDHFALNSLRKARRTGLKPKLCLKLTKDTYKLHQAACLRLPDMWFSLEPMHSQQTKQKTWERERGECTRKHETLLRKPGNARRRKRSQPKELLPLTTKWWKWREYPEVELLPMHCEKSWLNM